MRIGAVGPSVPAEFLFSFPQAVSAAAVRIATVTKVKLDLADVIGTPEKVYSSVRVSDRIGMLYTQSCGKCGTAHAAVSQSSGDEVQGHAIVAVTKARRTGTVLEDVALVPSAARAVVFEARRTGTVLEDVALVPSAARAVVFGAGQNQLEVPLGSDRAIDDIEEARPASPAVEFHVGGEQRLLATGANIGTGPLLVVQGTGPRRFGALFAEDAILLLAQTPSPFLVTVCDRASIGRGLITVAG